MVWILGLVVDIQPKLNGNANPFTWWVKPRECLASGLAGLPYEDSTDSLTSCDLPETLALQ